MLVRNNGTLGVIDFRIVGRLDEEILESRVQILFAYMTKDYDRIIEEYNNPGFLKTIYCFHKDP